MVMLFWVIPVFSFSRCTFFFLKLKFPLELMELMLSLFLLEGRALLIISIIQLPLELFMQWRIVFPHPILLVMVALILQRLPTFHVGLSQWLLAPLIESLRPRWSWALVRCMRYLSGSKLNCSSSVWCIYPFNVLMTTHLLIISM